MLGREGLWLMPTLLHPKSRGHVTLASSDPSDPPIIQPNYLAEPGDRATLVEGMKFCHRLAQTETFANFDLHPLATLHGNYCADYEPFSDDYFGCAVDHLTHTIYHPVGTCKMGPDSDPAAVVDHTLSVRGGVTNLRVVDASVMPSIVGGNTHAPTVALAEKVAADIVARWRKVKDRTKVYINTKASSRTEL